MLLEKQRYLCKSLWIPATETGSDLWTWYKHHDNDNNNNDDNNNNNDNNTNNNTLLIYQKLQFPLAAYA